MIPVVIVIVVIVVVVRLLQLLLLFHGHLLRGESNGSDELRRYDHQGQHIKVDVMAFAGEVTCKSPTPI
jgi:hypothetical protein